MLQKCGQKRHPWVPLRKPLLTEKNTMISHLPENILMALKSSKYEERAMATFGFEVFKVIYAPMRQKLNFLEGLHPVTSGLKPSIYHPPILQCDGGSVVVCSSFAASGSGQFAVSYEQLILLSAKKKPKKKTPKGECSAISCPEAEAYLGLWRRTIIAKTLAKSTLNSSNYYYFKSRPLWMA